MSLRRKLYQSITRGVLRPLAMPLYDAVIALELAWERTLDSITPTPLPPTLNTQLTALVKTFERPHALRRLVASIRRLYPGLPIIVVDDSRQPSRLPGVELVTLPFDSGVSAGRNAGLARVTTPYVLLLDDDRIFFRRTGLAPALEILQANPQIDLLAGKVLDLPFYTSVDCTSKALFSTRVPPTLPPGSRIAGLPVYDWLPNFYIARTERLRLVGWDPQIKRLDHTDFFTRARGLLTSVYDDRLQCLHAQTPFDTFYMDRRIDYQHDQKHLRARYFPPSEGAS